MMPRADVKAALLPVALLALALVALVGAIEPHDPIGQWLVWRYLGFIALAAVLGLACLSGGFAIAKRIGATTLPLRECLMQSFMLGVLAFAIALVGAGLLGTLGGVAFVLLPLMFLALGARPLASYLVRAGRRVRRLGSKRMPVVAVLGVVYALACFAGLYLAIMSPANVAYDARWYHLAIAEHSVAAGSIGRFEEGWFQGAVPHLASWLYTWAFCLPDTLFGRIVLAAHVEYLLFVVTVASLPVLVDQLIGRPRVRSAWAAFFLFPGILLYDSNLSGAADHVLAFWAVPIFVAWRRYWRAPRTRDAWILGFACAGALLTKYQAVYLVAFPAITIAARLAVKRRAELKPALVLVAAGVIATAPHWLLNLVWYGHPIYPMMGGIPLAPGIARVYALDPGFEPVGAFADRLWQTVKGVATFGFDAHDWPEFHGDRPVFGALFLPAVVLMPIVRVHRRLIPLAVAGLSAVGIWFWTYHQDRYLQGLTPWLAVFVVVVLASVWRQAWLARPFISVLVALQVLSCADLYFLPTHGMMRLAPIQAAMELITSGHRKEFDVRENAQQSVPDLSARLPPGSKVLVHGQHLSLGLGVPAVRDVWPRQGALNYAGLGNPAAISDALRGLGVTHVLWPNEPLGVQRFADEVAFFRFAQLALRGEAAGAMKLAVLGTAALPNTARVVVLGCAIEATTPAGLVDRVPESCAQPASAELDEAVAGADIVVVDLRLYPVVPAAVTGAFHSIFRRDALQVWGRAQGP